MGSVENEVVKKEQFDNFRHVYIQWWVLVKKGTRNDKESIVYNFAYNRSQLYPKNNLNV